MSAAWRRDRRVLVWAGMFLLVFAVVAGVALLPSDGSRGRGPPDDAAPGGEEIDRAGSAEGPPGGEEAGGPLSAVRALSMEHSYTLLFAAAVTGVLSRRGTPGPIRVRAQRVHKWLAFGAGALVGIHVLTQLDAVVLAVEVIGHLVTGEAAAVTPRMATTAAGVGIGAGATMILTVAALSFLRPRYFTGRAKSVVVHGFVYGGFAFATIHALLLGHDATTYVAFTVIVLGLLGLQRLWTAVETRKRRRARPSN